MSNHSSRRSARRSARRAARTRHTSAGEARGHTASRRRRRSTEAEDPFRPVARTAADVLAIIPHTLGFWPQDSVAVLTTTTDSVGPCLRVELPSVQELEDAQFLASWTTVMAGFLEYDSVGTSMFVAVYTGDPSVNDVESTDDAQATEAAQYVAQLVVRAITEAGALSGHDLQDAWCLQGTQWWPVAMPSVVEDAELIRNSAIYAALVCDGSVVEPDPAAGLGTWDHPSGWTTAFSGGASDSRQAHPGSWEAGPDSWKAGPDPWEDHPDVWETPAESTQVQTGSADTPWSQGGDDDPLAEYAWRIGYLERWNHVLSSFQDGAPSTPGDSQELTELMLGCVDPRGLDLLLAMALTGEIEIARQACAQWESNPLEQDNHALLKVAQVILGEWEGQPDWGTVDRFDHVVQRLISMVASISGATGVNPLPTVEASLWLARAHVERFRARGSRTQLCLARAENLAPWHPGIERLRQLCAVSPVPQWATQRATAWHRSGT